MKVSDRERESKKRKGIFETETTAIKLLPPSPSDRHTSAIPIHFTAAAAVRMMMTFRRCALLLLFGIAIARP